MSDTFTFWLGLRAAGNANAFCVCGDALDTTRRLAIHVADGTGTMRQVCDECASKRAPTLAGVACIERKPITMTDLLAGQDQPKWELVPSESETIVDQDIEVVDFEEEATFDEPAIADDEDEAD